MEKIIFFRNDDVRNSLDSSLIKLTEMFIEHKIPIAHAVEPANVSSEVINWLIEIKKKYPSLIEIMQHGYDHRIKNNYKKGEFGGQRTYEEQYAEIKAGKHLMNKYFGELWFPAFNFPYAPYNPAAIKAVDDCDFKVINSHFNSGISRRVFYFIGHLLNKGYFLDHHVSWNLDYYPNTNLFEIDMNISFIRKYHNEECDADFYSLNELINYTLEYSKYRTIGVLFHHRYHNNVDKMELVNEYLKWCIKNNYNFLSIKDIYEKYKTR